jgi:preprotein translocase subunit SecA
VLALAPAELPARRREDLLETVRDLVQAQLDAQWTRLAPHFPLIVRMVLLKTMDENWRQHLLELDEVRDGIGLRAYGGTDPRIEFKREAHRLFQEMIVRTEEEALRFLLNPRLAVRAEPTERPAPQRMPAPVASSSTTSTTSVPARPARTSTTGAKPAARAVGRNDPCPCGSGKKYKHCHGR